MPRSGEASTDMVPDAAELRRANLMHEFEDAKDRGFTVRDAAGEDADAKRENEARREEQSWD